MNLRTCVDVREPRDRETERPRDERRGKEIPLRRRREKADEEKQSETDRERSICGEQIMQHKHTTRNKKMTGDETDRDADTHIPRKGGSESDRERGERSTKRTVTQRRREHTKRERN